MRKGYIATNIANLAIEASHMYLESMIHAVNSDSKCKWNMLITKKRILPPFICPWNHFAYLSNVEPGMICYIERDYDKHIHKRMRIGRYIKKYTTYKDDDIVRMLSNKAQIMQERFKTHLVTSVDDCLAVYNECNDRESTKSCMTSPYFDSNIHPMSVLFEHNDIGVYYVTDTSNDNTIVARALVDHKRKIFPMVYGRWELIANLLDKDGYIHGSLECLELKIHMYNDRVVMPYIDGMRILDRSEHLAQCYNIDGDKIILDDDGYHAADDTDGLSKLIQCCECDCIDHEDNMQYFCDENYCESCYEEKIVNAIYDIYGSTEETHKNYTIYDCDLDLYFIDSDVRDEYIAHMRESA